MFEEESIMLGKIKKENLEKLEEAIKLGLKKVQLPTPVEERQIKRYVRVQGQGSDVLLNSAAKIINVYDIFTKLEAISNSGLLKLIDIRYLLLGSPAPVIDAVVEVDYALQVLYKSENKIGEIIFPYVRECIEPILEK